MSTRVHSSILIHEKQINVGDNFFLQNTYFRCEICTSFWDWFWILLFPSALPLQVSSVKLAPLLDMRVDSTSGYAFFFKQMSKTLKREIHSTLIHAKRKSNYRKKCDVWLDMNVKMFCLILMHFIQKGAELVANNTSQGANEHRTLLFPC